MEVKTMFENNAKKVMRRLVGSKKRSSTRRSSTRKSSTRKSSTRKSSTKTRKSKKVVATKEMVKFVKNILKETRKNALEVKKVFDKAIKVAREAKSKSKKNKQAEFQKIGKIFLSLLKGKKHLKGGAAGAGNAWRAQTMRASNDDIIQNIANIKADKKHIGTLLGIFSVGFTSIMIINLMRNVEEAEMAGYNSMLGQLFYNFVLASSNNMDFLKNIYMAFSLLFSLINMKREVTGLIEKYNRREKMNYLQIAAYLVLTGFWILVCMLYTFNLEQKPIINQNSIPDLEPAGVLQRIASPANQSIYIILSIIRVSTNAAFKKKDREDLIRDYPGLVTLSYSERKRNEMLLFVYSAFTVIVNFVIGVLGQHDKLVNPEDQEKELLLELVGRGPDRRALPAPRLNRNNDYRTMFE
tara:strand:- start:419 stop:1651 length:1233 start_codon:yes stop_codon:yes gene_type:complete